MQNSENKFTHYQLKKQAVFDVLYKHCERNQQEQVSVTSVLQYVSKELGSSFKSPENIINELNLKLEAKSKDGWILFADVCEILSGWMDKISLTPHCAMMKKTSETIEYTFKKTKSDHSLPIPSLSTRNNSTESERITKCYEQKVAELQNLLRQSEDCNYVIQVENESLRRNNVLLQNKEYRWITKEEQLAEREQQLLSANTFLKEQNDMREKEILTLKQQLSRLKVENEKMASENLLLEAREAERLQIEKHLCEAKLQQTEMQMDLNSKERLLAELETKLEQLQEYSEVLEAQISELHKSSSPATSHKKLHEQSLGEELMMADISTKSFIKSNDRVGLDIPGESSLRAELHACGQWPLICEHVAVQATPDTCLSETQTDEKWSATENYKNSEPKDLCSKENYSFHHSETCDGREHDIIYNSMEMNAEACEQSRFSHQDSETSVETDSSQNNVATTSDSSVSKNETCLFVPFVKPNGKVQANYPYQSTYEMELFIMVDALTQTEPLHQAIINEDVKLFSTYKLDSKKESIPVNSSRFLIPKSCAKCSCTVVQNRNRIGSISQSSSKESKYMETVKSQGEVSNVVSPESHQLFNISLKNALSMKILCKKQYGNHHTSITKLFCCNRGAIYHARSVCWNTIMQHKKQNGSRFQCRIIQVLIVMLVWYLFQTLTQFYDGHIWCKFLSLWPELHRVLAQKMELNWPRGPPPQ
ncbi:Protein of unknown function [Gryllus bimaculatus]|nr:Protein of unknown function [Gryllus bimaculatus]